MCNIFGTKESKMEWCIVEICTKQELVKKADPSNSGFIDFTNFCSTLYVAMPKIKAFVFIAFSDS